MATSLHQVTLNQSANIADKKDENLPSLSCILAFTFSMVSLGSTYTSSVKQKSVQKHKI